MGKQTSWDQFWAEFEIPFQEEDADYDFVNSVVVSRQFIVAASFAAELGAVGEALTEELANLTVQLKRVERVLEKFKVILLSRYYDAVTKSARGEIQDAFIRKIASEGGKHRTLRRLERMRENLQRKIEAREPRLAQVNTRLTLLEKKLRWAEQYLNFDKLDRRITQLEGRGR